MGAAGEASVGNGGEPGAGAGKVTAVSGRDPGAAPATVLFPAGAEGVVGWEAEEAVGSGMREGLVGSAWPSAGLLSVALATGLVCGTDGASVAGESAWVLILVEDATGEAGVDAVEAVEPPPLLGSVRVHWPANAASPPRDMANPPASNFQRVPIMRFAPLCPSDVPVLRSAGLLPDSGRSQRRPSAGSLDVPSESIGLPPIATATSAVSANWTPSSLLHLAALLLLEDRDGDEGAVTEQQAGRQQRKG